MADPSVDHPAARGGAASDCIVVTAADARYFVYAQELIRSIRASSSVSIAIGFLDLGVQEDQRDWLRAQGVALGQPQSGLRLKDHEEVSGKFGYLARPFLRESFPGYATYIWLDADTWLQDASALTMLQAAAEADGAAVVRQNERAYRFWPWLIGWQLKHFVLGYGVLNGLRLAACPHINNGVFAMRATAPHWELWQRRYQSALDRTGNPAPHDQFGLNAAVYLDRPRTTFLPATCNWIADLATPMWDEETERFCKPYPPHETIGLLHLAGPAKTAEVEVRTTRGRSLRTRLRYGANVPAVAETAPALPSAPVRNPVRI
ncbi:hypothetical protein [Muricoccus radiodurans]|uniref:hypothetical protein n=1 Tax=Muricoccus radiodurans TaxID=2231721 RepID=UPI003CF50B0E